MSDLGLLADGPRNDPAAMLLRSARMDKAPKDSKDRMRVMLGLADSANASIGLPVRVPSLPNRTREERNKRLRTIEKFIPFQHLISPPKPAPTRKFGVVVVASLQVAAIFAALFVRPVPRFEPAAEVPEVVHDEPEMVFLPRNSIVFQAGMTQPVRIAGTDPSYPERAISGGVKGTVIIRCVLTENGLAQNCTVLNSPAYLDEAVLAVAPTWRFTPVTWNGRAVAVDYVFKYQFKLG